MRDIQKEIEHIVDWIKEYFANNGENCKAIIGISGGKDSTIAAALCVRALGKDRVIGVKMPDGEQKDIEDANRVIKHLGIRSYNANIQNILLTFYSTLNLSSDNWSEEKTIKQVSTNTPPRIRMTILYAIAAGEHGRVCNTSNFSEKYIGWTTKFGDSVGDFSPLGNYTATEVVEIGKQLDLPTDLVEKAPDDGMCGRTDEDKFGFTYQELDEYITKHKSPSIEKLEKIKKMRANAEHKIMKNIPTCPDRRVPVDFRHYNDNICWEF